MNTSGAGNKTEIVPPDLAVRMAWAITAQWSDNNTTQKVGDGARQRLDNLLAQAKNSPISKEQRYVEGTISLIETSLRSLSSIYQLREENFRQLQQLRQTREEEIEAYAALVPSWQSAWPRLVSVGIGGPVGAVSLTQLVQAMGWVPKGMDQGILMTLLFAVGASLLYLLNEFVILPWKRRSVEGERIQADAARTRYFEQYLERSQAVLEGLYNSVNAWHETVFGAPYDSTATAQDIVKQTVRGMAATWCEQVHDHLRQGKINADLWSMCETGIGKEKCPHWRT